MDMGLTVKNKNEFVLGEEITNVFSFPLDIVTKEVDNYENLKPFIYDLDIDNEEKANILNTINSLKNSLSVKEKEKRKKEIEDFKKKYNI